MTAEETAGPLAQTDPGTAAGAMRAFLGRFNMALEATPENVEHVTEEIRLLDEMHRAMEDVTVLEKGQRFIWLKMRLKHGEWLPYLEANFSSLPRRTIQWWMAEAKYALQHGQRKSAAPHLLMQGPAGFTEEEAGELSEDDLADPSKPAPTPRRDLEKAVLTVTRKVEVLIARDAKHQSRILELEASLRDARAERDPWRTDKETKPVETAGNRALLALSDLGGKLRNRTDAELEAEFQDDFLRLPSLISRVQELAVRIVEDHGWRLNMKIVPESQPNEFPEEIEKAEKEIARRKAKRDAKKEADKG